MKKTLFAFLLFLALVLSLSACGSARPAQTETPAAEPQAAADAETPAEGNGQSAPSETAEPQAEVSETAEPAGEGVRQDGERYEGVIMLEGMEEKVPYEHIVNKTAGFEMDYDYESFARQSEADRECFVSVWDDPANPENYLEVRYDTGNAELVADVLIATLSQDYDIRQEYRELEGAGKCIHIAAEAIKGTNQMPEHLQYIYVIPASDGCRVATIHCFIAESEGFSRRFACMLDTLTLLEK